jgi:hypothetical protein
MYKYEYKQGTRLRRTLLSVALLAIVYLLPTSSSPDAISILTQQDDSHASQKITAEEVSWFTWLTGNSGSARFHFLDLLELLSRNNSQDMGNDG